MTIDKNKVVSVSYNLSSKRAGSTEENFIEKTEASKPFVFLFGAGGLIEGFEVNLNGKKPGDTFDFFVSPEKAYGERVMDNIANIPVAAFQDKSGKIDYEMLKVGNVLPMSDNQGNRMDGLVEEITAEFVRMDFNHPLAGHELHFKGEVLEVREATADEIAHGHVHGPHGHHH